MQRVPADFVELFRCHALMEVATVGEAGFPHITPVWADYDGEHVLLNTVHGRRKHRDLLARPEVGIFVQDPRSWARYISIGGRAVDFTTEGAREHIDALANRYLGTPGYPFPVLADRPRTLIRIEPVQVVVQDAIGQRDFRDAPLDPGRRALAGGGHPSTTSRQGP
jgi:PPOX class probable F420-dependent enzyme